MKSVMEPVNWIKRLGNVSIGRIIMTSEEKEKKEAELIEQGYVKDYVFNDGKVMEIWRAPDFQKAPATPKLRDKNGRIIPPNFSV